MLLCTTYSSLALLLSTQSVYHLAILLYFLFGVPYRYCLSCKWKRVFCHCCVGYKKKEHTRLRNGPVCKNSNSSSAADTWKRAMHHLFFFAMQMLQGTRRSSAYPNNAQWWSHLRVIRVQCMHSR